MAKGRTIQSFRRDSLDLEAKIINAIQKVGPKNISLLSRMTGAHAETIRYKVKRQFKTFGFRIDASVDNEKLGLTQYWAELVFPRKYRTMAPKILASLNESAYLTYYGKVVPQGHYLCVFSAPVEGLKELETLLGEMKKTGLILGYGIDRAIVSRQVSMLPAHFDFRAGRWDVDWARVRASAARPIPILKEQPRSDLDEYDLTLMRELQTDALRHVVGIARKLKVHQKTLEYHYRAHVQERKLIPTYNVRWTGEPGDAASTSVLTMVLLFKRLGDDLQRVQSAVSKIPYLWWESMTEKGNYLALLLTPVADVIGVLEYISEEAPDLHDRVEVGYVNTKDSAAFGVPSQLYHDGWIFEPRVAKARVAKLAKRR